MNEILGLARRFGDAKGKTVHEVMDALKATPTMAKTGVTAKTQTFTDAQAQVGLMVLQNWCKHI